MKQIARDHGCTVADVHAALDQHPLEVNRDHYLRRVLALELIELDQLQAPLRDRALFGRDVGAGALLAQDPGTPAKCCSGSQRRPDMR